MVNKNTTTLNRLLVNLFNEVLEAESKAVITGDFVDISNNDMHIIDAIGVDEAKNMSAIAAKLMVTVGTLTVNMNSLEKKGYIERKRSSEDKRMVYVTL
ncbi:MAG TPA: MarR family transcriptional regulator, partial [Lachnospiraceae bacterium]|nr:MarR family transcriptional regulator [Lachnospiraceae bacterium]